MGVKVLRHNKTKINKCYRLMTALVFLLGTVNSIADTAAIGVIYPEVRAPYNRIFDDIIKGIKQSSKVQIHTYALSDDDNSQNISAWLHAQGTDAAILLGSRGKEMAERMPAELSVIVGATLLSDDNIRKGQVGISLTPSPGKLFSKLKELAPTVNTVNVIYHPGTSAWLVALAKHEADKYNLTFVASPAENVRDAAAFYKALMSENVEGKSAVWLLQGDPTLDERSLLPTILNEAWNTNYVVFSSNPSHVKRGALFSLFPDNIEMGVSLTNKALRVMKGEDLDVDPLENLLTAVNVRTAEHLALKITRAQERKFNLVFPVK